jgi:hypothetical protein
MVGAPQDCLDDGDGVQKKVDKATEPSYRQQRRGDEGVSDSTGGDRGLGTVATGGPAEDGDTDVNERCLSGDKKRAE